MLARLLREKTQGMYYRISSSSPGVVALSFFLFNKKSKSDSSIDLIFIFPV